jgi:hypothetical protein
MPDVTVNMNDRVRARLTPEGQRLWYVYHTQFNLPFPSYAMPAADGTVETTLWNLMAVLREGWEMGAENVIADNSFTLLTR